MIQQSYDWILKCIESSTNIFQFDCCHVLIGLFKTNHKNDPNSNKMVVELSMELSKQELKHNIDV